MAARLKVVMKTCVLQLFPSPTVQYIYSKVEGYGSIYCSE